MPGQPPNTYRQYQPYPTGPSFDVKSASAPSGGGGGFGGAMDPITAIIGGLGGYLSGLSQADAQKRQIAEQGREFDVGNSRQFELGNRQQQQSEAEQANQIQRQMAMAPMRDRITYNLNARLGLPTNPFNPSDMFNPGSPAAGTAKPAGVDMNLLNQLIGQYTPGAGGQGDTSLQQAILQQLGYAQKPEGGYQHQQPGGFDSQAQLQQQGMPARQYIDQLAKQGNWDAIASIGNTGQGPSTRPGEMHRYSVGEQDYARMLLAQHTGQAPTRPTHGVPGAPPPQPRNPVLG